MKIRRTSGPTVEPVSLLQARQQVNLASDDATHDDRLTHLIQQAREQWEFDTNSATTLGEWEQVYEYFRDELRININLLDYPIVINSIKYYDSGNEKQTVDASTYSYDLFENEIVLTDSNYWPSTYTRWDAVTVAFSAGHDDASDVSATAKQAMLLLIGQNFENPDMMIETKSTAYDNLVRRYLRNGYP